MDDDRAVGAAPGALPSATADGADPGEARWGARRARPMQHTPASMLRHRLAGCVPAPDVARSDLARTAADRWVTDGGTLAPADLAGASAPAGPGPDDR